MHINVYAGGAAGAHTLLVYAKFNAKRYHRANAAPYPCNNANIYARGNMSPNDNTGAHH
jgi:hypothetical protein